MWRRLRNLLSRLSIRGVQLKIKARARGMKVVLGDGRETAIAGVRVGGDRIVRNPALRPTWVSCHHGVHSIAAQALGAHREFVENALVPRYGRIVVNLWGRPRYELCLHGLKPRGIWYEGGQLPVVFVGGPDKDGSGDRADRSKHLPLLR